MKYITPVYNISILSVKDVITTSLTVDLGENTNLTQIDEKLAKVSASVRDILGIK